MNKLWLLLSVGLVSSAPFRNNIDNVDIAKLVSDAKKTLEGNLVDGDDFLPPHTLPSATLYPNAWFWDEMFIAIGKSRYAPAQAVINEIETMLVGQWRNGFIPHIVFTRNPTKPYFPDWHAWKTNVSDSTTPEPPTSGITQPPVLATAMLAMWRNFNVSEALRSGGNLTDDQALVLAFVRDRGFPAAVKYFDFLRRERATSAAPGCAFLTHPWASGLDNSPMWDEAMNNIDVRGKDGWYVPPYNRTDIHGGVDPADRPSQLTYDRFVALMACGYQREWNQTLIA